MKIFTIIYYICSIHIVRYDSNFENYQQAPTDGKIYHPINAALSRRVTLRYAYALEVLVADGER